MTATSAQVRRCKGRFFNSLAPDATPINRKDAWRIAANALHVARQQGLHHQALEGADKERGGSFCIEGGRQFTRRLALVEMNLRRSP